MSTPTCPNGHVSTEADYCSVCGAPMAGGGRAAPAPPSPPSETAEVCPACGTRRGEGARYCEVCRYDFELREPGPPPAAVVAPLEPPERPAPAPAPTRTSSRQTRRPAAPATGAASWEVKIVVDPSLDIDPDPSVPVPTNVGERLFPIDMPEMLIGRRDDAHNIRPAIPITDPGVSRRHANLMRLPGGGLAILDLASANGTAVNGKEAPAGERIVLNDGDVVTMGRWTRITVRQRPASGR